ncbi:GNAT family N-acetyltransferase [Candidatus Kaiserbacteria bacterium]|nr:GNAT family N-acetyltransferase [Candidatus Kaiserbacteria bacterium]
MELVQPSAEYKDSFTEAVREYKEEAETEPTRSYRSLSLGDLETDFEAFVARERSHAEGKNQPQEYVPQTEFWLVDGGEYIGHVSVRQRLNEHLLQIGGHIGYDIRPSERGKGYGNKILKLALRKAKEMGIEKVRITCDVDNIASRKIIEKNGGVLDSEIPNPETGVGKLRYWIDVT